MPIQQGSLDLLEHPIAKELLHSTIPARLAYIGTDEAPRVVPIWFHWNGREIVMGTPPKAPKLRALAKRPKVSLTIDNNEFPHKVLLIRGTARLDPVNDIVPEYALAAERYFGPDQGKSVGEAAARNDSKHGAHHDHAPVGRHSRFPDPLPECAGELARTAGLIRISRAFLGRSGTLHFTNVSPCGTRCEKTYA